MLKKQEIKIYTPFMYEVEIAEDAVRYNHWFEEFGAVFNGYSIRNNDLFKARSLALIKAQLLANDALNLDGRRLPCQVFFRDVDNDFEILIYDTRGLTDEIMQNIQKEHELVHEYYENEDDWRVQMDFQNNLKNTVRLLKKVHKMSHDIFELPKIKHRYFSLENEKSKEKCNKLNIKDVEGVRMHFREDYESMFG